VEWDKAATSVAQLAELEPETVITGHGVPIRGLEMRNALYRLARDFDRIAVPRNGRYLRTPPRTEDRSADCDPGNWDWASAAPRLAREILPEMVTDQIDELGEQSFPISAGILFGLGLGGFFDGIVVHQLLQWHHMLTDAGYPPTTVENLKINTLLL
jgi:hypothetical protein